MLAKARRVAGERDDGRYRVNSPRCTPNHLGPLGANPILASKVLMKWGGPRFQYFRIVFHFLGKLRGANISDSRNLCIEIQLAHLICKAWSTLNLLQCQPPRFYFCACF